MFQNDPYNYNDGGKNVHLSSQSPFSNLKSLPISGLKDQRSGSKNTFKQETSHLTESRKDKAFRGFRHVVGAQAPPQGIETNFVPVDSIYQDPMVETPQ